MSLFIHEKEKLTNLVTEKGTRLIEAPPPASRLPINLQSSYNERERARKRWRERGREIQIHRDRDHELMTFIATSIGSNRGQFCVRD